MALSKTDQKRITFLSLFSSHEGDYDAAQGTLEQMEEDGFFEDGGSGNSRSSGRSTRSEGRGSGSRSSNRGRGGGNRGGGGGGGNPDWRNDEITDKQIDRVVALAGDDYTDEEIEAMTKGQASDIIDDLG